MLLLHSQIHFALPCLLFMNNIVRHFGVVEEVWADFIKVLITQTSACASCKVAGTCNASESKEKILTVSRKGNEYLQKGDKVMVAVTQKAGFIAVLLSAVLPLLLMVIVLTLVLNVTDNEVWAALSSLCSLLPYYLILYMMRYKIGARLALSIEAVLPNKNMPQ